jgi:hypothetical protein
VITVRLSGVGLSCRMRLLGRRAWLTNGGKRRGGTRRLGKEAKYKCTRRMFEYTVFGCVTCEWFAYSSFESLHRTSAGGVRKCGDCFQKDQQSQSGCAPQRTRRHANNYNPNGIRSGALMAAAATMTAGKAARSVAQAACWDARERFQQFSCM